MRNVSDSFKEGKNKRTAKLIYLYEIFYDIISNRYLRYTDYGKSVSLLGNIFIPYTIKHDQIEENLQGKVLQVSLVIGNVNREIQAIHENYSLLNKTVNIYTVSEDLIEDVSSYMIDTYSVKDVSFNKHEAFLQLQTSFSVHDLVLPRRYFFRAYCRFKFKDENCQYEGGEGDCNKTLQRCRQLGNTRFFGAFPAISTQKLFFK